MLESPPPISIAKVSLGKASEFRLTLRGKAANYPALVGARIIRRRQANHTDVAATKQRVLIRR